MKAYLNGLLAAACLLAAPAALAQAMTSLPSQAVVVEGAVERPGTREYPADTRLSKAVLAARPRIDAYPLGAALLRRSAVTAQTRDKAGLLFDLDTLADQPDLPDDLAGTLGRLRVWLAALPVTGRVRATLEPGVLDALAHQNGRLEDGDRFIYPLRPATVRVLGAVAQPCELPHVPLRDAADYLRDCPLANADRDWLFVIQPDGYVERIGVAAWNRSPYSTLAPGAVLYAPLPERAVRGQNPNFNHELARFIATQHLPAPEILP